MKIEKQTVTPQIVVDIFDKYVKYRSSVMAGNITDVMAEAREDIARVRNNVAQRLAGMEPFAIPDSPESQALFLINANGYLTFSYGDKRKAIAADMLPKEFAAFTPQMITREDLLKKLVGLGLVKCYGVTVELTPLGNDLTEITLAGIVQKSTENKLPKLLRKAVGLDDELARSRIYLRLTEILTDYYLSQP